MSRALKIINILLSELELELDYETKNFERCIRFREGKDDLKITKKYKVLNRARVHAKHHFEKRKDTDILQSNDYIDTIESFNNKFQINDPNCKLILLIRHGAGEHNITKKSKISNATKNFIHDQEEKKTPVNAASKAVDKTIIDMFDPILTDEGKEQCLQLSQYFKVIGNTVDLVVISPLTRTIETAVRGILPHVTKNNKTETIVVEFAREIMNGSDCTKRRSINQITKICQQYKYDFKFFGFDDKDDIDSTFDDNKRETPKEIRKRAEYFLDWLMNDRKENIIAYSGHSGMILAILQIVEGVKAYYPKNGACIPLVLARKSVS